MDVDIMKLILKCVCGHPEGDHQGLPFLSKKCFCGCTRFRPMPDEQEQMQIAGRTDEPQEDTKYKRLYEKLLQEQKEKQDKSEPKDDPEDDDADDAADDDDKANGKTFDKWFKDSYDIPSGKRIGNVVIMPFSEFKEELYNAYTKHKTNVKTKLRTRS
jgi:predicted  nucleic acid-binding Zn-ribbon protein